MNMKEYLKIYSDEVHKPAIKNFERRRVIESNGAHQTYSIDLADLNLYKQENDGYRYIFCVIDIFSRFAWCRPLKNKKAETVLNAFEDVVEESGFIPHKIYADDGSEWKDVFGEYIKKNNITLYHTYSDFHSSIIERFHKSLKDLINRYFTENQTHQWVEILPELLKIYNNRKHRTIKMSPADASKEENYEKAFENQYGPRSSLNQIVSSDEKFKVGDKVRISRKKNIFEKDGFNWSGEIFTVSKVNKTNPVTFNLTDSLGESIIGAFYSEELQKTALGEVFLIEKILDKRTVKRKKQSLVKWLGYSDKHNSWINDKELIALK